MIDFGFFRELEPSAKVNDYVVSFRSSPFSRMLVHQVSAVQP
jgi:hypothetical protein